MSQPATLPGNWRTASRPARTYGGLTRDAAREFLRRAGVALNTQNRKPVALCVRMWRERLEATETLDGALRRDHLDRHAGGDGAPADLEPGSREADAHGRIAAGDPSVLLERALVITPVIDPVYDALLIAHGVERTSVRGYAIRCSTGAGRARRFDPGGLEAVLRVTRHDLLCTADTYRDGTGHTIAKALSRELSKVGPYQPRLRFVALDSHGNERAAVRRDRGERAMRASLSGAQGRAWLTVCTFPDGEAIGRGSPMDIWSHPDRVKPRRSLFADAALAAIAQAEDAGLEVYDPDSILAALRALVANATVARPVPGRPGLACVIDGQGPEREPARYELPAGRAAEMIAARAGRGGQAHMHGAVADVAAMAAARRMIVEGEQAAGGVPLPRGPQAQIVARHLATRVGFANASMMGTGKCVSPDTRVLIDGVELPAGEVWERFAAAERTFDGEGEWAAPSAPILTASLAADGSVVPSAICRLYRQRVSERGRKVTLIDGSSVTITRAHRLHGPNGWTRQISPGDPVAVPAHPSRLGAVGYVEVAAVEPADIEGYVYDFEVHHNYVAGGMLCHNTSMTLWGMRLWARQTPYYRGLVIVACSHLTQWSGESETGPGEIGRFFPEAAVLCPEGMRGLADQLLRADRAAGKRPLLVVATYEQARRGWGDLRALAGWHDLVVDEAEVLANPHAQLSVALWSIREKALRALALTGTPISKRTRDLHAIIAWAREDREMLSVPPPGRGRVRR